MGLQRKMPRPVGESIAVLVLGLLLTGVGATWLWRNIEVNEQYRFDRMAARLKADIEHRFELPTYGLEGLRALYAVTRTVEPLQFRAYVESHPMARDLPGVTGFGYAQRVPLDDGAHRYRVMHIEPPTRNAMAPGMDLAGDPVCRSAIERAVRSGMSALAPHTCVSQEAAQQPGFVHLLPLYRDGTDAMTPSQREATAAGVLYVSFGLAELLANTVDAEGQTVDFELFDGDAANDHRRIHDTHAHADAALPLAGHRHDGRRMFQSTQQLSIGGHALSLRVSTAPRFESAVDRSLPWLLGLAGCLLSAVLALVVWLLAAGRVRAERLAQTMMTDLDRLAKVAQHTSNAVVILDERRRITWVNAAFTGITGYGVEQSAGKSLTDLMVGDPQDAAAIEALRQALQAGVRHHGELRRLSRDGREFWLDVELEPLRDGDGQVSGFMALAADVTEAKRAAGELAHERERLDNILRGTNVGTWEWNVQTGETHFNGRGAEILGCSPEELSAGGGRVWMQRAWPEDLERADFLLSQHFNGLLSYYEAELRMRHSGGHWVWVLDRGRVSSWTPDGKPEWMSGTHMDITPSKQLEAQLRASEAFLDRAGRIAGVGAWEVDLRTKALAWSDQTYRIHELPFGQQPRLDQAIRFYAPEAQPAIEQAMQAAVDQGQSWDLELPLVTAAGRGIWVRVVGEVQYEDGVPARIVGALQDVTARRGLEQEMRQAMHKAEQASVAKSQFLANMSHEIRTPMNAILGMLQLLRRTTLSARQFDYAQKTENAARSLLGLLNDILDFSKVEAGKMSLDPMPFRLDLLMRDLSVILSANVGPKNVEVLFDVDAALPQALVGDALRLQQVLINLAGNAIKFTEAGEVLVQLRLLARHGDQARIEIAVRDTGIGIAPEHQQRIFTGFTQAEASTTRRFGGTGLGLAISQRLVALMGGELALQSRLGEGSRFSFQLTMPVVDGVPEVVPAAATPAAGALRALIVDDNPTAREVLATMAASLGWHTDLAASGEEALALLQAQAGGHFPYQAVFIDWQMPGMDGWEACLRIRELSAGDQVPLMVMVTAHGREMLAQRSPQEQALLNGFLVKPVTASMLFDAVADARAADGAPALSLPPPVESLVQQRRLAGLRLLLVEDNPNNRQVALELLGDEGAHVVLANNGQEGVAALAGAERPFDAVLMDIQMPVMDGYTATAQIRQRLGLATLPVIAMTANAMASDREACLAAGMNDHVGKPFDLTHLVTTLLHHTGRGRLAAPSPVPAVAAGVPESLLAEATRQGLDVAGALNRLGGHHGAYERMVNTFLNDMQGMPTQLAAMLREARLDEAARLLHTVKGLAATLGARALATAVAQAEPQCGGNLDAATATALVAGLQAQVRHCGQHLQPVLQWLQSRSAPAIVADAVPADTARVRQHLEELRRLVLDADLRALDVFAELRQAHGAALGDALQPLDDAVTALAFVPAAAHCGRLIDSLADQNADA